MTISHGFQTILGVGAEITLGTAVAATEKICIISESLAETIKEVVDSSLCGTAVRGIGRAGTKEVQGGFVYPLKTDLGTLVLKKFFGTFATDTPDTGQNCYSLDNNIDGDGLTIAVDKQVSVYEFAGYKTSQLTLTGNPSDGFRISVDGFAKSLSLTSVANTSMVLAALSEPGTPMLFQDCVFRIADLSDALQASDAVSISNIEISINRNLEAVEVNSQTRTEAIENGFRESTLKFTIPLYQSNTLVNAHRNHTSLQADLVITTGSSVKTIQMPLLTVTSYKTTVGGPDFVELEVECSLYPDPDATNAFMTLENVDTELQLFEE